MTRLWFAKLGMMLDSMHIRLKHEVYSWSQNQRLEFGFHDGKSELEVMLACY